MHLRGLASRGSTVVAAGGFSRTLDLGGRGLTTTVGADGVWRDRVWVARFRWP